VLTSLTDVRGDLPKVNVPAIVMHGSADRSLPTTAPGGQLVADGALPGMLWTHADGVTKELLAFVQQV